MKMRRVVIGGEWMFSFFLVSLFFGLLCRAGFPIIKQESNSKRLLSTTYDKRTFRSKKNKKQTKSKKKKHSYSSKVQVDGESDRFREFEQIKKTKNRKKTCQYELKNAYTQSSLIHGFCLIFFYIVKK